MGGLPRPSRVTIAAVQLGYSVNGSNLRDTGHSVGATPPAAKADLQPLGRRAGRLLDSDTRR